MATLEKQFSDLYLEVLNFPIKEMVSGIISCIRESFFIKVANTIKADSMCVYLYEITSNTLLRWNIYGNSQYWKDVDPVLFYNDNKKENNYSFFDIRYSSLDGKPIRIGFIGVYKQDLQSDERKCMELLGMIYGNYISKRILRDQIERLNEAFPRMYEMMSNERLSGTVVLRALRGFKNLMRFYKGFYFTVDGTVWFPEYVVKYKKNGMILGGIPIQAGQKLTSYISLNQQKEKSMLVSLMPDSLQNVICWKDEMESKELISFFYPMLDGNTVIGLWLIVFYNNQRNYLVNTTDVLRNIHPYMSQHYKYLYQRRTKKMIVEPIFKERDTRLKEQDVFVIMPFTENWSDSVWNHAIKPIVESLGLNAVRADNLYGQNIMEDVWKGILQSSIVIADITGRNANVFYELGIAHTLGKRVILLTQNVDDIPFDLKHLRHIIYKTDYAGGDKLKTDLKKVILDYMRRDK